MCVCSFCCLCVISPCCEHTPLSHGWTLVWSLHLWKPLLHYLHELPLQVCQPHQFWHNRPPPPPSYPARYRRNNSGVNKVAWLKMTDWSTASNAVQLTDRRNSYNCMSGYVTWCTKELSCHDNGHYMLQCTHDAFFVPLGLHGIATDLYYIQVHGIAPRNKPSRLSLSVSVSTIDQLDHISLMIGWIVCMCMYVYIYIYIHYKHCNCIPALFYSVYALSLCFIQIMHCWNLIRSHSPNISKSHKVVSS